MEAAHLPAHRTDPLPTLDALRRPAGPRLLRLRSDEQLVARFRAGDDEAFDVIHDRYRPRLLAYVRQMLGPSRADAEDALQDVLLRAHATLRADDRPVALRAWLYRVAHNRCIDVLRRPVNATATLELPETLSARDDPAHDVEAREDLRRLVADIGRLPEQQRSALLMRELEGLGHADLAAALDVSVPAIKSLLVRARIGLTEARLARDTACREIQQDLAVAHDAGRRPTGLVRRHVRECACCADYRGALRGLDRHLAALAPAGGPWALAAKLLGLGSAGSAGGGAAVLGGSGAVATSTTVAAVGSTSVGIKVAALVSAAAVAVGGSVAQAPHVAHAPRPAATAVSAGAPAAHPVATDHVLRPRPAAAAAAAPARVPHAARTHRAARTSAAARPTSTTGATETGGAVVASPAAPAAPGDPVVAPAPSADEVAAATAGSVLAPQESESALAPEAAVTAAATTPAPAATTVPPEAVGTSTAPVPPTLRSTRPVRSPGAPLARG